jgi:hypothetical protein
MKKRKKLRKRGRKMIELIGILSVFSLACLFTIYVGYIDNKKDKLILLSEAAKCSEYREAYIWKCVNRGDIVGVWQDGKRHVEKKSFGNWLKQLERRKKTQRKIKNAVKPFGENQNLRLKK